MNLRNAIRERESQKKQKVKCKMRLIIFIRRELYYLIHFLKYLLIKVFMF